MNYGELKAAIAARLTRSDLTAVIPDFISLGESRLYYGFKDPEIEVKPLRLRAMLATETAALSPLPAGFLAVDRLTVPDNPLPLVFKSAGEFDTLAGASIARYYTIKDGGISVEGGAPDTFSLSYYKKFDAFALDSDTNWLLTNHPNIYFYSALIEAYQHIKKDAQVVGAVRMFASAANAAANADESERYSGSVLQIPVGNAV